MSALLSAAWLLARKDLRLYFRDRTAVVLGFLLPAALVTIFGFVMRFAFGSTASGEGMPRVRLVVADLDRSEKSRALVSALRDAPTVAVEPEPGAEGDAPGSVEEAREWIADGDAHHVLVIPQGFGADVAAGRIPQLQVVRDPGRALESRLVSLGILQAFMAATEARLWPALFGRTMERAGMEPEQVQSLVGVMETGRGILASFFEGTEAADTAADEEGAASDLADFTAWASPAEFVDVVPGERPGWISYQLAQVVSGMTVMMLLFGLVACAMTLMEEREQGTLRRLLVAPVPRSSVLLGKFILAGVIGLLQLAVLLAYGDAVFRVGMFRDPITLAVLVASTTAAVTSFGILVAGFARTRKQAEGLSTLVILVMCAVGGAWFPVQYFEGSLPLVARVAMRCTLVHWAMSGMEGMLWYRKPWTDASILGSLAVLWGFAAAAGAAAWALFRRRLARP